MGGRISYLGGIVRDGLVLDLDAAKIQSYPRTGTLWYDISGNQNNGTLINGPTFDSNNGGSIVFDGIDDSVLFPKQNYLVNITQFTMCAWMKRTLSNSLVVIGQVESLSNDISFEIWNDGNAYFEIGNGTNSYGYVANTGTNWQHLSMIYDGTQTGNSNRLKGYVNGVLQTLNFAGTTIPSTTGTVNSNLSLGKYIPTSTYSKGNISQFQIYNRALSASEVLQNYNATKGRYL